MPMIAIKHQQTCSFKLALDRSLISRNGAVIPKESHSSALYKKGPTVELNSLPHPWCSRQTYVENHESFVINDMVINSSQIIDRFLVSVYAVLLSKSIGSIFFELNSTCSG